MKDFEQFEYDKGYSVDNGKQGFEGTGFYAPFVWVFFLIVLIGLASILWVKCFTEVKPGTMVVSIDEYGTKIKEQGIYLHMPFEQHFVFEKQLTRDFDFTVMLIDGVKCKIQGKIRYTNPTGENLKKLVVEHGIVNDKALYDKSIGMALEATAICITKDMQTKELLEKRYEVSQAMFKGLETFKFNQGGIKIEWLEISRLVYSPEVMKLLNDQKQASNDIVESKENLDQMIAEREEKIKVIEAKIAKLKEQLNEKQENKE